MRVEWQLASQDQEDEEPQRRGRHGALHFRVPIYYEDYDYTSHGKKFELTSFNFRRQR